MSAWVEGKLQLKCSIDILRKAIINIHPEWEDYLVIDQNGTIPMYRYNGQKEYNGEGGDKQVHLLIPGSGHPGIKTPPNRSADNDWGFFKESDDSWSVTYADYGLERAKALEGNIKAEIALMKAKAIAKMRGYEVLESGEDDEEKYVKIRVKTEKYKSLI
jgi:hypothetical protein